MYHTWQFICNSGKNYIYIYITNIIPTLYTYIILYILYMYIHTIYIKKQSKVKRQSNTSNKEIIPNGIRKMELGISLHD